MEAEGPAIATMEEPTQMMDPSARIVADGHTKMVMPAAGRSRRTRATVRRGGSHPGRKSLDGVGGHKT